VGGFRHPVAPVERFCLSAGRVGWCCQLKDTPYEILIDRVLAWSWNEPCSTRAGGTTRRSCTHGPRDCGTVSCSAAAASRCAASDAWRSAITDARSATGREPTTCPEPAARGDFTACRERTASAESAAPAERAGWGDATASRATIDERAAASARAPERHPAAG
jgi:hypothetical protein